jgi:hypothetical protein
VDWIGAIRPGRRRSGVARETLPVPARRPWNRDFLFQMCRVREMGALDAGLGAEEAVAYNIC